jgi:hypothetical protein
LGYGIAAIPSDHPDAEKLREELAMLAGRQKRSAELRASFTVRVSTFDDFNETAFRVTFKRLQVGRTPLPCRS